MPLEYTHLYAVNAYAGWLDVSGITEGYLFQKIDKNDCVVQENVPMVCIKSKSLINTLLHFIRLLNNSLRCFEIISLILVLTPYHMGLTHSVAVDVNGYL